MATAALPGSKHRPLLAKLARVAAGTAGKRKWVSRAYAKVREHVTAIAALGALDLGGFEVCHHGGWFFVAVSLVLLQVEMAP